ncbi:MAG: hypothetical protein JXM70_00630 [Pirellulales bacterium]|nr:hypothetical protein [Pirellulales bacterium]
MNNTKKIIGVIAILLMLFSMALYVASDDEAVPPVKDASLEAPTFEMPAAE